METSVILQVIDSKELRTEETQTEADLLWPTIDSVLGQARLGDSQS